MKSYFQNNKLYLLGFLVLSWVVLVNLFPQGYVFAGGDTAQLINAKNHFFLYLYDWQGRTAIFYSLFYLLDLLGVTDSSQLSWYLGIFIFGAYISFDLFVRILFKNISPALRMLTSIFYALNLYTLFLFSGNTGYSHYPSLYIFIPLISGLFIKFLLSQDNKWGVGFILTIFLASSGFGNPAFALSLAIFLVLTAACLSVLGLAKINKKSAVNLLLLIIFSILTNAYWIATVVPSMKSGVADVFQSEVLPLNQVLSSTANPIVNTFSLISVTGDHFPYNFPYNGWDFLKKIFIVLSFFPIIMILARFIYVKKFDIYQKRFYLSFGLLLLAMTMLAARVIAPFEVVNHFIFNLWGMNTLRGFDKTGIYIPFILAVLLLLSADSIKFKNWVYFFLTLVVLVPFPFYTGKFQQNVGYRNRNGKDFRSSSLSFLVKIPDEYYSIADTLNNDHEKSSIATLPYGSNDGSGVARYPLWKLYGVDITSYLYNKKYIAANSIDQIFGGWNFAREFTENQNDGQWMVKLLGLMNARYILYHKDNPEDSVKQTQYRMDMLEEQGMIKKIDDNNYFSLYRISDEYFVPYITWQKQKIYVDHYPASVEKNFQRIKSDIMPADFKELNPEKFLINASQIKAGNIVLAEPFNDNWKAYAIDKNGKEKEIAGHYLAVGYANGWAVGDNPETKQILIEYYPERLMRLGIAVSLITVVFLCGYLIIYLYAYNNKKRMANFL